jgi:transposase
MLTFAQREIDPVERGERYFKRLCRNKRNGYRDVSHQMFPGRPVVIDKFHVVRMANYCMERVRIRLQKQRKAGERRLWLQSKAMLNMRYAKLAEKGRFNLDMWLANEPELAAAYGLKEAFYNRCCPGPQCCGRSECRTRSPHRPP